MTTKEKIDIDIVRIRILRDFESKFLECRELWFENVLDRILKKHLKPLQGQPTYEQWFERWKQLWYKEWWRARGEELTEDKLKTIDEVISYIWQKEWREESEDYYRKHFWLKLKYKLD